MRAHQIGSYLQIRPTDDRYAGGNRSEEASKGRSAMTTEHVSTNGPDTPGRYEIRLKGRLDARWAAWFDGLSLSRPSRPPESSHREQRRAHPKARRCSHAHQEPRGDCRATRGGVTSRQKQDRRRTGARWNLPASAASPRRSTLTERGPMSSTAPAAETIGRRRWRWAHRRRAIRGDHGHVDHRRCLRGVVRHHGVSSRAPLTEFLPDPRFIRTSQPSGEESHVASHS
jgi:hypothetical protein